MLFEEKDGEYYKGHTTNYIEVFAKGEDLENVICNVNVTESFNNHLTGNIEK